MKPAFSENSLLLCKNQAPRHLLSSLSDQLQ